MSNGTHAGRLAKDKTLNLHHAHIFASDIDVTIAWWQRHLKARVLFDGQNAGARNVMLGIGRGRLNLYDQPPRDNARGVVHHLGIRVNRLRDVWAQLQADGLTSPHGLRQQDGWRYVMIAAPDNLLLELFEFDDPTAPFNIDG